MAKRTPYTKPPAAPPAKPPAATRRTAARTRPERADPPDDALPSLADLKRARAKLDAAIAMLERKVRRKK